MEIPYSLYLTTLEERDLASFGKPTAPSSLVFLWLPGVAVAPSFSLTVAPGKHSNTSFRSLLFSSSQYPKWPFLEHRSFWYLLSPTAFGLSFVTDSLHRKNIVFLVYCHDTCLVLVRGLPFWHPQTTSSGCPHDDLWTRLLSRNLW